MNKVFRQGPLFSSSSWVSELKCFKKSANWVIMSPLLTYLFSMCHLELNFYSIAKGPLTGPLLQNWKYTQAESHTQAQAPKVSKLVTEWLMDMITMAPHYMHQRKYYSNYSWKGKNWAYAKAFGNINLSTRNLINLIPCLIVHLFMTVVVKPWPMLITIRIAIIAR